MSHGRLTGVTRPRLTGGEAIFSFAIYRNVILITLKTPRALDSAMTGHTDNRRSQREAQSSVAGHVRDDRQIATAWAILLGGITATVLVTPAVAFVATLVPFMGLLAVSGDAQCSRGTQHADE